MTTYRRLAEMYIEDKKLAWSESALHSERYRLLGVVDRIDGDARKLWDSIQHLKAYTRVTVWGRVSCFYAWCLNEGHLSGPNPYAAFREKNARLFKNAYVRRKPEQSFEDTLAAINTIPDALVKRQALEMIYSGLRYMESISHKDGFVRGKGNKERRVYVPEVPGPTGYVPYRTFLRVLKQYTGLKPHDLRKLFLSRLVDKGADPFVLCEVAGWASVATAASYIKVNERKTRSLVALVQGADNEAKQVSGEVSRAS